MTNLSDLFPAGAGKQVSFTASGNVTSSGKPVVLNSDGTVSEVSESSGNEGIGTPVVFDTDSVGSMSSVYDSNANKVVVVYGGNGGVGYAIVGTISGTSVSFGTRVAFESDNAESMAVTFDSNSNKIVIAFRYAQFPSGTYGYGYVIIGTVSGTSITFSGAKIAFNSANTTNIGPDGIDFDSTANKVVIAFRDDGNSDYGTAIVGTVSGTSITFGSEAVIETNQTMYHSVTYDPTTDRTVIAYRNESSSGYGQAKVGEISGTSITLGASANFEAASTNFIVSDFDSSQNKVVIAYSDAGNSAYGTGIVGTVTGGGTNTIAFGTAEVFNSASTGPIARAAFDTNLNKTIVAYCNSVSPFYGYAVRGTVSGTGITFSTPFLIASTQVSGTMSAAFDASTNNLLFSYADVNSSSHATGVVYTDSATNLTSTNFLGISDAAISSAASGNITIKGGIAATGLSSLTPASDYYVQDDGTITTVSSSVKAGKALSATAINLEYQS
jgi:hypothetical protein